MCKPFLIRSWANPGLEYELADVEKFRELYRPGFYIAGGTVPPGVAFAHDELAPWLKPYVALLDDPPADPPATLTDDEV